MRSLLATAGAFAALAIAPAAQSQDKASRAEYPVFAGAYEPEDVDERGLWASFDEVERKVSTSKDLIRDDVLNQYLQDVLCNSVGDDRCNATRIYIVRNNAFNASMAPNGMMMVNSGLLLRMRNEAELASVLGHEFSHFEQRHSLQLFKRLRSGSDIASIVGVVVGVPLGAFFLLDVFSFNREMEKQADITSADYLAASPYASAAAADIWVRLIDEDDARAEERKRRKRGRSTGWFASHPAPLARSEYLARAAEIHADDGEYGYERYAETMDPFLLTFFEDQLQRNDFAASRYILDQMAGDQWRAVHYVMQGELYRKRGMPRDLVTAEESYRAAIDAGTTRPEAWRGLGLTLMRARNREQGAEALATYLELAPDAPDAPMMQMMIKGS